MVANAASRSFGRTSAVEQRHHVRIAGGTRAGDEVAPGALAQLEILHLVELGEARRHAGLDRPLAQQPRAERVNGPGEEALEIRERATGRARRCSRAGRRVGVGFSELGFERQVEAPAQLRGRLARERDGGHVLDLVDAGGDAGRHPLGEHLRLARAGAGLDEDVGRRAPRE